MSWRSHLYYWRFRKPKHYQVAYHIQLPQTEQQALIAVPIPVSADYQTITDLQYQTNGKIERHEQYLLFQGGSEAVITFAATVQPRQAELPSSFTVADYHDRFDTEYYCQPDRYIHSQHPAIQAIVKQVADTETNLAVIVPRLYQHTLDQLSYGNAIPGLYTTTQALNESSVDCGGFVTYLGALLRASRVPCRLIAGFWAGQSRNDMHAWLEFMLPDGQWVPLDPSVHHLAKKQRTSKFVDFNFTGSDRIMVSTGSEYHLHIRNQELAIGMLQTPVLIHLDGSIHFWENYKFITT